MIFDTSVVNEGSINDDRDTKFCELKVERTFHDTTYDSFLAIYLGFDDSEEDILDSWVILQSKLYG